MDLTNSRKKLITVFTPTYNRVKTLEKCYQSLLTQTSKNFIWSIIDDGSQDGTEELVNEWVSEDILSIRYLKSKNQGKAAAMNLDLDRLSTPLWFCLDSDDYLFDNAVQSIEESYPSIEHDKNVCGFFALRANASGEPMQCKKIPPSVIYTTQSNVRYGLRIPPEYTHVFKSEVINNYRFPLVEGEKYFPLSYLFDQIDQDFLYKVLHTPFMVCEYQSDGITLNKRSLIRRNPIGYMLYKRQLIEFAPTFIERFKASATYVAACLLAKEKGIIQKSPKKLITIMSVPLGILDYVIRYRLNIALNFEGVKPDRNTKDK